MLEEVGLDRAVIVEKDEILAVRQLGGTVVTGAETEVGIAGQNDELRGIFHLSQLVRRYLIRHHDGFNLVVSLCDPS